MNLHCLTCNSRDCETDLLRISAYSCWAIASFLCRSLVLTRTRRSSRRELDFCNTLNSSTSAMKATVKKEQSRFQLKTALRSYIQLEILLYIHTIEATEEISYRIPRNFRWVLFLLQRAPQRKINPRKYMYVHSNISRG